MFAGICFHRLYNSCIGNLLATDFLRCDIEIDGSSIVVHKEIEEDGIIKTKGKASVSDITQVNGAVLMHTGINVTCGKQAPATAYSTGLTDDECIIFMHKCIESFYGIAHEIFLATTKRIV